MCANWRPAAASVWSSCAATSASPPTSTARSPQAPTDAPASAVIHFAGRKAVGESVDHPLWYYDHNVTGTVRLLQAMQRHGVHDLVFSSSCTVYGEPERVPITEDCALSAMSPYGRSKLQIEDMFRDLAATPSSSPDAAPDPGWRIALLRYFNPVGAHPSGRIGEDPVGIPNNLMPYIMQVAVGVRDHLTVHGDDYPTPDGTAVRDYLHVMDLAEGHLAALERIDRIDGAVPVNLGTGVGSSVLDVVHAAREATGRAIPYEIGPRRPGDVVAAWADATLAAELLGWRSTRTLGEMCADHWRWQEANPQGFRPQ